MNFHKQYAINFNCTVAQAIGDRDAPATLEKCVEWFKEAEQRDPTPEEIQDMRPDTFEAVESYISESFQ
jgi:hypothetical protein